MYIYILFIYIYLSCGKLFFILFSFVFITCFLSVIFRQLGGTGIPELIKKQAHRIASKVFTIIIFHY